MTGLWLFGSNLIFERDYRYEFFALVNLAFDVYISYWILGNQTPLSLVSRCTVQTVGFETLIVFVVWDMHNFLYCLE